MSNILKFILTEDLYKGSNSGIINGTLYHELPDGSFTCLNEGELYVGTGSQFGKLKIYGSNVDLLSSKGNLIDLIESNNVPISFKSIDLYVKYLGFGSNKFMIGDYAVKSIGGNLIISNPTSEAELKSYDFSRSDEEQFDSEEVDSLLSELNSEIEYYDSLNYTELPELILYGDIADYLSVKTLVDVHQVESGAEVFEWIERKVNEGDLLELNINYKYFMREKSPVLHGDDTVIATNTTDPDPADPLTYYLNDSDTITKIDVEDSSGKISKLTWNGYHVTFGNLTEYTKTCRLEYRPGFIELEDFIVNITSDSIVLYSKNEEVVEYYISTCKIINKASNQ